MDQSLNFSQDASNSEETERVDERAPQPQASPSGGHKNAEKCNSDSGGYSTRSPEKVDMYSIVIPCDSTKQFDEGSIPSVLPTPPGSSTPPEWPSMNEDRGSEDSSDDSNTSQISTEQPPRPGETLEVLLRQFRRIEVEEHARFGYAQTLQEPVQKLLHILLDHVEKLEPLVCRRLQQDLLRHLQYLFRFLVEHTCNVSKLPAKTLTACIVLYMFRVRAILGFKHEIQLHRRLCFLDWYTIQDPEEDLTREPLSKVVPGVMLMAMLPSEETDGHYLYQVPYYDVDCWMDSQAVRMVKDLSGPHVQAFRRIYGIDAEDVHRAVQTPGMRHVLDVKGFLHINSALTDPEQRIHISENVAAALWKWEQLELGTYDTETARDLELLISGLLNINAFKRYPNPESRPWTSWIEISRR